MKQERFIFKLYDQREINSIYIQPIYCHLTQKHLQNIPSPTPVNHGLHLVKDIPNYLEVEPDIEGHQKRLRTIDQYRGFLLNLSGFNSPEAYLTKQLSKRNRKNLFSKKGKLEKEHDISCQMYFGQISKKEYDSILDEFYAMLKRRFHQKKTTNRYLERWEELYNILLDKILQKEASLFVIRDQTKPIGIALNYHMGELVLSHIQTYDVDFAHYNIGDILMLKHLEWCFKNKVLVYDLSMGDSEFKSKWCNFSYRFCYQLFYDRSSFSQRIMAFFVVLKYKIKNYLRNKRIIGGLIQFDRLNYYRWSRKINE
ncbi:MAG: GNAT family N-acetyltransferase, partial [Flavobacteriaceae bacterium]